MYTLAEFIKRGLVGLPDDELNAVFEVCQKEVNSRHTKGDAGSVGEYSFYSGPKYPLSPKHWNASNSDNLILSWAAPSGGVDHLSKSSKYTIPFSVQAARKGFLLSTHCWPDPMTPFNWIDRNLRLSYLLIRVMDQLFFANLSTKPCASFVKNPNHLDGVICLHLRSGIDIDFTEGDMFGNPVPWANDVPNIQVITCTESDVDRKTSHIKLQSDVTDCISSGEYSPWALSVLSVEVVGFGLDGSFEEH